MTVGAVNSNRVEFVNLFRRVKSLNVGNAFMHSAAAAGRGGNGTEKSVPYGGDALSVSFADSSPKGRALAFFWGLPRRAASPQWRVWKK